MPQHLPGTSFYLKGSGNDSEWEKSVGSPGNIDAASLDENVHLLAVKEGLPARFPGLVYADKRDHRSVWRHPQIRAFLS